MDEKQKRNANTAANARRRRSDETQVKVTLAVQRVTTRKADDPV